jgi:hypothetical protein
LLIISNFHDFYDTASGFGIDKTIVYQRKTEDLRTFSKWRKKEEEEFGQASQTINVKNGVREFRKISIGYCGHIFPMILVTGHTNGYQAYEPEYLYSKDELAKFLESLNCNDRKFRSFFYYFDEFRNPSRREIYFNYDTHKDLLPLFQKHKVPVFVNFSNGLVLNPRLATFKFQKVKDPFTAFQEIQGYISGVLGTKENEMVQISDKDMLHKKGFFEWSFKKLPTKKRK